MLHFPALLVLITVAKVFKIILRIEVDFNGKCNVAKQSCKRWIEDIEEDIQIMGTRGWRKFCKERAEWKKITENAKTHSGL